MKTLIPIFLIYSSHAIASDECNKLTTPNDVLRCIVDSHSAVQVKQAEINEVALGIEVASQRPNPELDIEAADQVGAGFVSEVSLLHTFELGGKRSARIRLAERERDLSEVNLLSSREQLSVQTVADLYRLRQIEREIEVVAEIISTFQDITMQYSKAGRLSPEDEISVSVFRMALEENKLKRNSLGNEKRGIIARIEGGINRSVVLSEKLLPKFKTDWPGLRSNELAGSQIAKAKSELDISNAAYSLEQAQSWPSLSVGPRIEIENSGTIQTRYGLAVSVPLPLYQANGGGRAKSLAGVKRDELNLQYTKTRLEKHLDYLHEVYKRVATSLTQTLSSKHINTKHTDLHKMINRGVVSAPIVIELHRQIADYYERLHEQELEGVMALWQISALEGRILKEELK
jgi:cobalt-zinc-cadmium efflux system outer membrane protein